MTGKQKIIAIAGPTASGKTALSVSVACNLKSEVISFDSMQLYRGMKIGTAQPSSDEIMNVPHHMIDCIDPLTNFSCADYAEKAETIIKTLADKNKIPILCGGTGLYLDSLLYIDSFSEFGSDPEYRSRLSKYAEQNGVQALYSMLAEIDPDSAEKIHPNNVRRVIRALEMYHLTGKTKTQLDIQSLSPEPRYDHCLFVTAFHNRELLYERIDKRVDTMIKNGLLNETQRLLQKNLLTPESTAWQAIGYKELIPYFSGDLSLEECAENIKRNTRRYAKRQITWFKRYKNKTVVYMDEPEGEKLRKLSDITEEVNTELKKHGFII